jgi:tRNA G18 (ribose-2'-O)-methylase SpoU
LEDTRNIIDHYKYWTEEAIKADLDTKRHNFSVVCLNFGNDFNIGSVIRNANAFLASEVIIVGRRKWDRRGAVGTHNYMHFSHVSTADQLADFIKPDWFVVGLDNRTGAVPIEDLRWPTDRHVVMVFGQEDIGIQDDVLAQCHMVSYIKQYGSVRSLNVGCASAIAMHEFCRKVVS